MVNVGMNGRVTGNRNKAWIAGFGGTPNEGSWQDRLDRMTAKRGCSRGGHLLFGHPFCIALYAFGLTVDLLFGLAVPAFWRLRMFPTNEFFFVMSASISYPNTSTSSGLNAVVSWGLWLQQDVFSSDHMNERSSYRLSAVRQTSARISI